MSTGSSWSTTHSACAGTDDLFAVGDATAGAYKQGGLAAQQADVVAEQIAERVGAEHPPRPYRPVLRGLLSTARGPRYLRAEPPGGAISAEVSDQSLWWPASKVAARWLTPWLAARDVQDRPAAAASQTAQRGRQLVRWPLTRSVVVRMTAADRSRCRRDARP